MEVIHKVITQTMQVLKKRMRRLIMAKRARKMVATIKMEQHWAIRRKRSERGRERIRIRVAPALEDK